MYISICYQKPPIMLKIQAFLLPKIVYTDSERHIIVKQIHSLLHWDNLKTRKTKCIVQFLVME